MAILAEGTRHGQWLRMADAAAMAGMSVSGLRHRCNAGEIETRRTLGGQRLVSRQSLSDALGMDLGGEAEDEQEERGTVVYARVSTGKQKTDGNLTRQVERLAQHCHQSYGLTRDRLTIVAEAGSGLKEDRRGYLKLIDLVLSGRVARVVVEYEDRLARYGVKVFQALCDRMGVELVVTGEAEEQTDEEEMASDIMSMITVYAARKHGRRGGEATRLEITGEARSRIMALHRAGLRQTAIAEQIQIEGLTCPKTGKVYGVHTVRLVLGAAQALKGIAETGAETETTALHRFIRERCVMEDGVKVSSRDFYEAFTEYAKAHGERVSPPRALARQMGRIGHQGVKSGSGYLFYHGLRLA